MPSRKTHFLKRNISTGSGVIILGAITLVLILAFAQIGKMLNVDPAHEANGVLGTSSISIGSIGTYRSSSSCGVSASSSIYSSKGQNISYKFSLYKNGSLFSSMTSKTVYVGAGKTVYLNKAYSNLKNGRYYTNVSVTSPISSTRAGGNPSVTLSNCK